MRGRDVARHTDGRDSTTDEVLGRRRIQTQRANGDVSFSLGEIEVLGIDVELELDAVLLLAERQKCGEDHFAHVGVGARHADRPREPRVLTRQPALERLHFSFDALGARDHLVTGSREQVAVAVTIEELYAEAILEACHPAGYRGVAHGELGARGAHGARSSEREEVSYVVPVHGRASIATIRGSLVAAPTSRERGGSGAAVP